MYGLEVALNELALFAGAGGGILGGKLLGWRTVCAVEVNAFCARRLMQRQNEGHLSPFPVWDDVRTFDGSPWRGIVDVVSGGFPCQDISNAGNCEGITGEKSGLWRDMARIICEVRPRYAFIENVAALAHRGLGTVLGDLAAMGMDAKWGVFSSCGCGAAHTRERMFVLAYADSIGCGRPGNVSKQPRGTEAVRSVQVEAWEENAREFCRVDHEMARRLDRLTAVGNGQDARVVRAAWEILST
jgi:DNA (cytosine-5)-methyltransferase 1